MKMVNFFVFVLVFFFWSVQIKADTNLEINAEQFTFEEENSRIYATGNVEIIDKEFKLYADKVFLNNKSKVLSAKSEVKIFNSDGTIMTANSIVADQSLNNAVINNNYIYYPSNEEKFGGDYLRLAAKKLERKDKNFEKMQFGVFSACRICKDEKTKLNNPPLIQFKAKKIIHDKKNENVKYYDAFIDLSGKSFFYLPYFSHASPMVKYKSGFLAPKIFQSYFFGVSTDIPFYYNISEFHDFTVTPKISTKKNPALFFEYRKNFYNGEIRSKVSGTIENRNVNQLQKNKNRGHIETNGLFDISDDTYIDFKLHRVTDRNYLNTYKYGYQDVLKSYFKIRSFRKNNYYSFESHVFQDLRRNVNQREVSKVLPRLHLNLNSDKKLDKLNFSSNLEFVNLKKDDGTEIKRAFFKQKIQLPYLFSDGSLVKIGGAVYGAGYHIKRYDNPVSGKYEYDKYRTNFFPEVSIEYTKPYRKRSKTDVSIITPKVMLIKSNKKALNRNIPDFTDLNFEYDISDIFNTSRLPGNDRFDNNTRIDYGINFLKNSQLNSKNTIIEVGQSYHFEEQIYLDDDSGIKGKFSDFVSRVRFNPITSISLESFLSINKKNYSIRNAVTQFSFGENDSRFRFSNTYSQPVLDDSGANVIEKKNQFNLFFDQKLIENWNFTAGTTFDRKQSKNKFLTNSLKLKYEDECLGLSFSWIRSYTHNPEDPTSNSFMFLFSFKEIMENDF